MPTTRSRPRPRPRPKHPAAGPTFDDPAWRAAHRSRTYVLSGLDYDDYAPAYRYGVLVADKHGKKAFAEVEPLLAGEWAAVRGTSRLDWNQARPAVQDGYAGVVKIRPVVPARRTAKARTGRAKARTATKSARTARAGRAASTARATTAGRTRKAAAKARSGDNLRKRGPGDRARVNVNEPWEVDYWCERLGVTPAQLRRAVKTAGPMARDVRRQLGK